MLDDLTQAAAQFKEARQALITLNHALINQVNTEFEASGSTGTYEALLLASDRLDDATKYADKVILLLGIIAVSEVR